MRLKIGTAEFNQHLFSLINAAMSDGQMGPFEINGALFAGMAYVDRSAVAAAKVAQDRKQSEGILQVKTMPPPASNRTGKVKIHLTNPPT